jgi:hypothetical protein
MLRLEGREQEPKQQMSLEGRIALPMARYRQPLLDLGVAQPMVRGSPDRGLIAV